MSPLTQNLNNLSEQVAYSVEKFQSKVIFEGENQKTILMAFSAGQGLPEHKTTKEAVLVMLDGICEFTMFGDTQLVKFGEVIQIPAGELHSLKAATNFKMLLIK